MPERKSSHIVREASHRLLAAAGAVTLTLLFFMVLPLMTSISKPPDTDVIVHAVDTADLPPPPPPPEEREEEKEPDEPEEPPELEEDTPPLDITQLELLLNVGMGEGMLAGDYEMKLDRVTAPGGSDSDALFSLDDLDQKPRVIYQPGPELTAALRKKAPGAVYVIFVVDQRGRVDTLRVERSSDPVFNNPALKAVKQWRFEPGTRQGHPVRFRMRVPITFSKD